MKNFHLIYTTLIVLVCCLILCFTTTSQITTTWLPLKETSILIYVKNKYTDEPIDNATICILNTREYYSTNKYGYTDTIKLQLYEDSFDGEFYYFDLLIYKNGFNEFLYFNLKTKPNQKRTDIVIDLTEIINDLDNKPNIFFEPPQDITIKKIIKENKR